MAYLRPGVYVEEVLNPVAPVPSVGAGSIAAFIGVTDRGPATPTLVTSWTQYTSLYGSWGTNNTVTTAVYLFFANGGSQCYVQRVTAGSPAVATRSLNDTTSGTPVATLKLDAINVGAWGNSIWYKVTASQISTSYFNLEIYYGTTTAAGVLVERYADITMNTADANYAPTIINAKSNYVKATDLVASDTFDDTDNPATTANPIALTSGSDGTAPTATNIAAGVTAFDTVLDALILNAPGITVAANVNTLLAYAGGRGDVFVVIDGVNDTAANQITLAATYTSSPGYGAVYFPVLTIPSPTSAAQGATVVANPGAAVMGVYVSTDTARGVFKSPAGLDARLSGVVSVPKLTSAELDSLNSAAAPVNAIRYIPGSGIVVMGARTLKAGYADRYISVRRSLIYIEKSLKDLTRYAVFEPNDFRLWNSLTSEVSNFLTDFWAQGGLRGQTPDTAFFVRCDSTNNPTVTIDAGEVHIEVGVALQRPAEFVVIRISQYDNGTVVTVS